MRRFQDKVVFITGASSGIGRALALEFGRQGAKLVLTARREGLLRTLAQELQEQGVDSLSVACDVTKDGDLERATQETMQKFGKINVVVANAGYGVLGATERLELNDFRRQFETNVFGVLRTFYATLEELKRTKGSLVLIGSVMSYMSLPKASPYSMSKFCIKALADALYFELKRHGISVTLINPGFVQTEIRKENGVDPIPLRLQMPADLAARKIARATAWGCREVVLTKLGKLGVFIQRHFPWLLTPALKSQA